MRVYNTHGKRNPNYKHGLKCNTELQGIYNIYMNMRQRCNNPNHPKYHRYGGRGIRVYEAWDSPTVFAEWMIANGWKPGMQIDRIDNNGNYTPENCRVVTQSENSRKKSTTKLTLEQANIIRSRIENGEQMKDVAIEFGVVHGTIWFIYHNFTHVPDGECTKKLKERC